MKESQITTDLYCIHCQNETLHQITYLNGMISHIECKNCSRQYNLQVDIKHELLHELWTRVKSKPSRITKEYRGDLSLFIQKFPRSAAKKPYRLYKEAKELKQLLSKYTKR